MPDGWWLEGQEGCFGEFKFFCGYQQKQDHPIIIEIVFQEDIDPDGTSMR